MMPLPSGSSPFIAAVVVAAVAVACKHTPSAKEQERAVIHHDLGVQHQQSQDIQAAYKEFDTATKLDPYFPEAWNAKGILLHLSFRRPDEAIEAYKKAIALRPTFTDAKVNLANVYLDQQRYDEAIKLYEDALNDISYFRQDFASGNLGWALYKKGEVEKGIGYIRAAVTHNPKFCLGYRNLGEILDKQGKTAEACGEYQKYKEACSDRADAYYRQGLCQAKLGNVDAARENLAGCQSRATDASLKQDCASLLEKLQ